MHVWATSRQLTPTPNLVKPSGGSSSRSVLSAACAFFHLFHLSSIRSPGWLKSQERSVVIPDADSAKTFSIKGSWQ